jgi:MFS family permease
MDQQKKDDEHADQQEIRKVVNASFIGTALEWFDYFVYGSASALVFGPLFFPNVNPLAGILASFATFAVGFLARPFGAIFFGHLGDKYGRKRTLTITVVLMGLCSGAVGLLPTYAAIGVMAPILLTILRILQGFSVGGEWGGAILLVVERVPRQRRGFYASIVQISVPIATLASSGMLALFSLLPENQFMTWGWRIPFLFAFALAGVGLYLRLRVEESPVFQTVLAEKKRQKVPLLTLLWRFPGRLAIGALALLVVIGGFYFMTTFVISYGTGTLGLPKTLLLVATIVASVVQVPVVFIFGWLTDRIPHWRVCAIGSFAALIVAFPDFMLINSKVPWLVILGVTVGVGTLTILYAPIGPMLSDMFPAEIRYTSVALTYNVAGVISGFVPLIATAVFAASSGQAWGVESMLALICLLSLIGALAIGAVLNRERRAGATEKRAASAAT